MPPRDRRFGLRVKLYSYIHKKLKQGRVFSLIVSHYYSSKSKKFLVIKFHHLNYPSMIIPILSYAIGYLIIIEAEIFKKAQDIININKRGKHKSRRTNSSYILSGLIKCKTHSTNFHGHIHKSGNYAGYRYYENSCSIKK